MTRRLAAFATALSLLAGPAFAGATARSFSVGAVVVATATVTATVGSTGDARLFVQRRGVARPMVLAADGMKPLPDSGIAELATPAGGYLVATILY